MALIHNHSCECAKSELDLFLIPGTQTSIVKGQWIEYTPVSPLSSSSPIDFLITGSGEHYIDLNHTMLYVKCKITEENGTPINTKINVGPVNLLLHSLFDQVNITLNDTLITHSNTLYSYRAMIETLLNYGEDAITSQLTNSLFYKDTSGKMDSLMDQSESANIGLKSRSEYFSEGKSVELLGPIHSDIFFQSKYLLNLVNMKIKLNRNRNSFCLMSDGSQQLKIHIDECKIYVRKVIISPPVITGHAHALLRGSAKYPIDRTVCKNISISEGIRNFTQDNLFFGQIPKNLIISFVEDAAFSGDYTKNPFNFKHYNINYLALYLDNDQYPFKPLQMDFNNNIYLQAYNTLFTGSGKMFKDVGGIIDRKDYPNGYTFFCYDLTPDLETQNHYSPVRQGDLRIDIQFEKALPHTIDIIIYAVFENIIQIDSKRRIIYDYTT